MAIIWKWDGTLSSLDQIVSPLGTIRGKSDISLANIAGKQCLKFYDDGRPEGAGGADATSLVFYLNDIPEIYSRVSMFIPLDTPTYLLNLSSSLTLQERNLNKENTFIQTFDFLWENGSL